MLPFLELFNFTLPVSFKVSSKVSILAIVYYNRSNTEHISEVFTLRQLDIIY